MNSHDGTRELSVKHVAWLTKVAPANAKKWFGDPRYPTFGGVGERTTTTWEDLRVFCARAGRASPLPLALLDMTSEDADALLQANSAASGTELSQALSRERRLRGSLRNLVAARTHQRQEAAMSDLALRELLDLAEGAADGPAGSNEAALGGP